MDFHLPITKISYDSKEIEALKGVLSSGWIMQGPAVESLELILSRYTEASFACAVSSGTSALHLSLLAVGVKPGNIVLCPTHSFIATANSIRHAFAEPFFIDNDPNSLNISHTALKNFLENKTYTSNNNLYLEKSLLKTIMPDHFSYLDKKHKEYGKIAAVMPVHQLGFPCDIVDIVSLSKIYGLAVLEDAACALGSSVLNPNGNTIEKIGKPHGDVACFSLHPRKIITSGEGGLITTNSPEIATKIKSLRQHAMLYTSFSKDATDLTPCKPYAKTGYNYRLSDIHASLAVTQFDKLPAIIEKRAQLLDLYRAGLIRVEGCSLYSFDEKITPNWQSLPLIIDQDSPITAQQLSLFLKEKGISTRLGVTNIHHTSAYKNHKFALSNAEEIEQRTILLPLYDSLTSEEINFVCQQLKNAFRNL